MCAPRSQHTRLATHNRDPWHQTFIPFHLLFVLSTFHFVFLNSFPVLVNIISFTFILSFSSTFLAFFLYPSLLHPSFLLLQHSSSPHPHHLFLSSLFSSLLIPFSPFSHLLHSLHLSLHSFTPIHNGINPSRRRHRHRQPSQPVRPCTFLTVTSTTSLFNPDATGEHYLITK